MNSKIINWLFISISLVALLIILWFPSDHCAYKFGMGGVTVVLIYVLIRNSYSKTGR